MRRCLLLTALLASACGGAIEAEVEAGAVELSARSDATGIHSLEVNGIDLFEGVGGYYIIGTCTGADDPGQNVISKGGDGRTLHAPGQCPGAPYSITIRGDNPKRISIRVGPLPVAYRSISVPLDPTKRHIDRFAVSAGQYETGCANDWRRQQGSSARFDSIRQPCHIPGHGDVGAARVPGFGAGLWGEISGPVARVRRTVRAASSASLLFYRHPYTHNIEIGLGAHPAGAVITLDEELEIFAPGTPATQPAPMPPGVAPGAALTLLYRAILGREPDPSGASSFSAQVASGDRAAMKLVARALFHSAEHRANIRPRVPQSRLQMLYLGFFARALDETGRGTYLPWMQRGEDLRVIDALIDSAELGVQLTGATPPPQAPPPQAPPPQTPPPSTQPGPAPLLDALYLAVLGRAPDPSGRATFESRLAPRTAAVAVEVTRELVGSPEFRARAAAGSAPDLLEGYYRGLFGRAVDPSGRTTFLPRVERGAHLEVLQALLTSAEMATRL